MGLEVETLEKPLKLNSSLGTRVSVDKICQDCELEISEILRGMFEFDVILGISGGSRNSERGWRIR